MKEDGVVKVPLIPEENVYRFGVNRQEKPQRQHSLDGQYGDQRPS